MYVRSLAVAAAFAALLAVPGIACALPLQTPHPDAREGAAAIVASRAVPRVATAKLTATGAPTDGGGTGTVAVIAIAAGALLLGALAGFGGGRVVDRRQAAHSGA